MHFQIYIPGATSDSAEILKPIGLTHLVPGAIVVPLFDHGPDGGRGAIVSWPGSGGDPVYLADHYEFTPAAAVSDQNRPAGRYWVGFKNESPPKPRELAWPTQFDGKKIRLGDGQEWQVPAAGRLPRRYRLRAEDGRHDLIVKEEFREFWEESRKWYDILISANPTAGVLKCGEESWWDYVFRALQRNYRLTPEVEDRLGLLDNESVLQCLMATVDGHTILEVADDQKKTAVAPIPAGTPSSPGGPD